MKKIIKMFKSGVTSFKNAMSKDVIYTPSCVIPIKNLD